MPCWCISLTIWDLLQQVKQCWWVIPLLLSITQVSKSDICTWQEVSLPLAGLSRRQAYFQFNLSPATFKHSFAHYNGLISPVWYSPTFIRSPLKWTVSKETANGLMAAVQPDKFMLNIPHPTTTSKSSMFLLPDCLCFSSLEVPWAPMYGKWPAFFL